LLVPSLGRATRSALMEEFATALKAELDFIRKPVSPTSYGNLAVAGLTQPVSVEEIGLDYGKVNGDGVVGRGTAFVSNFEQRGNGKDPVLNESHYHLLLRALSAGVY